MDQAFKYLDSLWSGLEDPNTLLRGPKIVSPQLIIKSNVREWFNRLEDRRRFSVITENPVEIPATRLLFEPHSNGRKWTQTHAKHIPVWSPSV